MQLLEVGKLFKEGVTRYQEGCRVDVDDTGINLFLYYNNPTEKEVILSLDFIKKIMQYLCYLSLVIRNG